MENSVQSLEGGNGSTASQQPRRGIWRRFVYTQTTAYADFDGRATRADFWSFYLFEQIFSYGLAYPIGFCLGIAGISPEDAQLIYTVALIIVFGLPTLSVGCRRLHDLNLSGWWQLSFLLVIPAFVLLLWPSDKGPNRFGPPCPEGRRTRIPNVLFRNP